MSFTIATEMTTPDYTSIIPYKINMIVSLIIDYKKLIFEDAINYLYQSKLYEYLGNEKTKLWHLSPNKLFELLENEKQNNKFEFPDFV